MRQLRRRLLWGCAGLVGLGAVAIGAAAFLAREPRPDTRFTGAYRFDDGELAIVVPYRGAELRLTDPASGESRPLLPLDGDGRFRVGPTGTPTPPGEQPAEEVTFTPRRAGERPEALVRSGSRLGSRRAQRIPLREEPLTIDSGGLALRARLVLPPAGFPARHPAAVIVHGSGKESAVDFYRDPYLLAPHGIATLVFDKRGTGGSEGTYTQNFHVLARDVVAAVAALRARPDIDPGAIHLVGYSQGGWIAPLAASRTAGIRSLVIGYGPLVPIVDEDRWGYVYTLRKKGFGDEAIAAADAIHETLVAILDRGESGRWDELERLLDAADGQPWFTAIADSDSALGFIAAHRWVPLFALRGYARWMMRPIDGEPFADRLYDPEPVVAGLQAPSLWIFGGDDHSMPTEWTIAKLDRLRQRGAPIEVVVYREADHGIVRIARDEDGERRSLGFEPGYMLRIVDWLRGHSRPAANG